MAELFRSHEPNLLEHALRAPVVDERLRHDSTGFRPRERDCDQVRGTLCREPAAPGSAIASGLAYGSMKK